MFRRRDPIYKHGIPPPNVGPQPAYIDNIQNNQFGSFGEREVGDQENNSFLNGNRNLPQQTTILEADKVSGQYNFYMPSLYGLNSHSNAPNPSVKVSDKLNCFRVVVIQDAGIRKKHPLFDSAIPISKHFPSMQHKLNKTIHHSVNELSLFMFGCYGMPISENNVTTKMHYLPALANMSASILVTRLFSIDSSFKLKPHRFSRTTSEWDPRPILETDELPINENSSIRFSLGLIIPVSSSIESVREEITELWPQMSESLRSMQDVVCACLKHQYSLQNSKKAQHQQFLQQNHQQHLPSVYVSPNHLGQSSNNSGFQTIMHSKPDFSLYCLQTEIEIYKELSHFLSHIVSLIEIPRLFVDLKHSNQTLINWATTLSLWLELKDGKVHQSEPSLDAEYQNQTHHTSESVKFLASLLYILLPLRTELLESPDYVMNLKSKLRVVISTGNPIVSQKLIFIVSGILGYEKFSQMYTYCEKVKNTYQFEVPTRSEKSKTPLSDPDSDHGKRNILTRNNSLFIEIPSNSFEAQIKSNGFSIPSPSVSTISANVQSQRIPVPSMNRTSSYASLQSLSTSYNGNFSGSIGSQSSSTSWRNNLGSFMDRWKSSMSPSPTTSQMSQSHSHSSQNDTPSPSLEYEEYPWFMMKKPTSTSEQLCSSPAPSFVSLHTTSTQQPSKYTLTNNHMIGNYKSKHTKSTFEISRTSSNLIGAKLSMIKESVSQSISTIMTDDFECFLSESDESVIDVNSKGKIAMDVPVPQMSLPLLVGCISHYRPEFSMMSCPSKNLKDNLLIDSMKEDLKNDKINESRLYFINLGTRNVDFIEMRNKKLDTNTGSLSDQAKGGSHSKSNLTKNFASNFELKQFSLLSPTKHLQDLNTPGITQFGNVSIEDQVQLFDQLLEKIASIINNFFYEISINEASITVDKEDECCNSIRQLIGELLDAAHV
ncbi:hypothetical protein CANINC_003876 [Pichia inconspicua]|uniref:Protein LST4 n=1 Tax=Pichia inconspicua TaxID=52247 RepID=A0A4V4NFE8_9ASCO|nr:hypothetical protein CANINC_003876 [[Candida] inconspicua]